MTKRCNYCSKETDRLIVNNDINTMYKEDLCPEHYNKLKEEYNKIKNMNKKEIGELYKERFKNLETMEELDDFIFLMHRCKGLPHMEIRTKRTGKNPYHFTEIEGRKNRVHYLYDDGVSEGRSQISNLSRHLKVRVWA